MFKTPIIIFLKLSILIKCKLHHRIILSIRVIKFIVINKFLMMVSIIIKYLSKL